MKDYKRYLPSYKLFRSSTSSFRTIFTRSALIVDEILGQKFAVHVGNAVRSITPKEEMLNTPIGFYTTTKITGSSIHKRKRKKKEKKKRGRK